MQIPRIIIAGSTSGVGKTSVTCGIIYGLQKKGYSIQPFKVGPDYIDPSYLSTISANNTRNLDSWIMGPAQVRKSFITNSESDISVIEGVMGYYDGYSGSSDFASTHHIATLLECPVLLLVDASKTSRSIAATIMGFKKFRKQSKISGVILNKIGSKRHEEMCKEAISALKIPIVGTIPRNNSFNFESRHLGLIPTVEEKKLKRKVIDVSKKISDYIDIEKIVDICHKSPRLPAIKQKKKKKQSVKIAVALDNSFNFYYTDNFDALRREGAELEFFSPIHDKKTPACDGLYIGGGFPEVQSVSLEKNTEMKKKIKKLAEGNLPIYAECGGLMYLSKRIQYNKKRYNMVGFFDAETVMTDRMVLNYTQGKFQSDCIISNKLKPFSGHEFHYSKLENLPKDAKFAYRLEKGFGILKNKDGLILNNTLASYGHLYFDSSNFAKNFVTCCLSS
ncbi:MAG: hydrogenobyrinic acid a,c-diamide synthase (glutamine-hydrolyzing) [Nitrosopumilaceae archaeon]|nr:hydrogenobyrinic acid a,c-diamide synthase (glutamine-hydrolyzing) [Nitrosopumilaceae archaeon]NIU00265.1 hydrogenobyrinic acid a,c-diamide synthase (glutamine-hydrolyzing) [Nitrosopumilaceae archaeon]NIU86677.1 hydrogenobyrinic acid a,c-diamide synthase (glutamine-hydrolyzing) [Nitrosopumilaceae archaeon]NIV65372.1 hydrogenobyrinic acid a,c-diamide synthase (glutamine-hydrolyzing) [Nitrosopumilaceae archaeon]NIX60867.1 hydrogenobyrinic acid a,c-diamide synthase (glutamine-hydrolyzing) [Nitr